MLASSSLKALDFENNALIEATLRLSDHGRSNNFDLIQKQGWVFIREEIVADFPYLTLIELKKIIVDGVKGKLDQGKTVRPLNFTRVYQWVEWSVQYTVSYWQMRHPDLIAWLEQLGLMDQFQLELKTYQTPGQAFSQPRKFRLLCQQVVRKALYPDLGVSDQGFILANLDRHPEQVLMYNQIGIQYTNYCRRFPNENITSQPIF